MCRSKADEWIVMTMCESSHASCLPASCRIHSLTNATSVGIGKNFTSTESNAIHQQPDASARSERIAPPPPPAAAAVRREPQKGFTPSDQNSHQSQTECVPCCSRQQGSWQHGLLLLLQSNRRGRPWLHNSRAGTHAANRLMVCIDSI